MPTLVPDTVASERIALPVLEFQDAADPLPGGPAPRAERAVVAVKLAAAIAEQRAARGRYDQLAGWIDAVLQRHAPL